MEDTIVQNKPRKLTADYFTQKSKQAKGPEKFLVALEMGRYISEARQNGISFEELVQLGFKFATV